MLYIIALGSNQRHPRFGRPAAVLEEALRRVPGTVLARSRTIASRPIGPSLRCYANGAAVIDSALDPRALLAALQGIESAMGRRKRGQRWRARVIDLDIILWSGGMWCDDALTIPHREYRARRFVLAPASELAPDWRDPLTGRTIKQQLHRLDRKPPAPREPAHPLGALSSVGRATDF